MTPRLAVVTIVRGRHDHLLGQRWGLARQSLRPDLHVVVAMADPTIGSVLARMPTEQPTRIVDLDLDRGRLPLAAARNAGVAAAAADGAEVVVLLDVDCIPAPDLLQVYVDTVTRRRPTARPAVACGLVRYLDEATTSLPPHARTWPVLAAGSAPHPARPAPLPGSVRVGGDTTLFWSLSFACTTADWARIGGFDEGYVGYGGEDTDFGQRLEQVGGTVLWLGGATAYHQFHGTGGLPVEHVHDIVENATRFAARWGWWPMRGWLDAFVERGLVRRGVDGAYVLDPRADAEDPHRSARRGVPRTVSG